MPVSRVPGTYAIDGFRSDSGSPDAAPADAGANADAGPQVPPPAERPMFSPGAGVYVGPQSVTISSTEPNSVIRYTTDGTSPTSATGTIATGPITVSTSTVIRAITIALGKSPSIETAASFFIIPQAPVFSPGGGTYENDLSVTMSTPAAGARICYTSNGTDPHCGLGGTCQVGSTYGGPIAAGSSTTLKAVSCISLTNPPSAVTSATYDFKAAAPTSTTASGTVAWGTKPIAQSATAGAMLLVTKTFDGSTPADPGVAAPGTCLPVSSETIAAISPLDLSLANQGTNGLKRYTRYKVRACKPGYALSDVVSFDYNVTLPFPRVWTDAAGTRPIPISGPVSSPLDLYFQSEVRGSANTDGAAAEGVLCVSSGGTTPQCTADSSACASTQTLTITPSEIRDPAGVGARVAYSAWVGINGNDYNAAIRRKFKVVACRPGTIPSAPLGAEWTFVLNLATYLGGAQAAPSSPQLTSVAVGVDLASESLNPATPATSAAPGHVIFGLWNWGATTGTTYAALSAPGALTQSTSAMPPGLSVYYTEDNTDPVLPAVCGDATPGPSTWKAESSGALPHMNLPYMWQQPSGGTPVRAVACAPNWTSSAVSYLTLSAAP